jgi:glycerol-3-phosphate dehydrogenase (NAD(P)+)
MKNESIQTISIIGATTWGNTIGALLAGKDLDVRIWVKSESRAREFNEAQKKLPPGETAKKLLYTTDISGALQESGMVIFAVPAQSVRQTSHQFREHVLKDTIIVNLAKGLEASGGKRMTEIIREEIQSVSRNHICVLSGPNLSQEINRGLPATTILAAYSENTLRKAQQIFDTPGFSVFPSKDVVGVEICGALKNVIALGAGMVDGLGLGNNAKATLITMGWNEALKMGLKLGAKHQTFYGLAGLGDLITTSAGSLSRNHYVGREVAAGRTLPEVKASMSNIAEGIDTTMAIHRLNHKLKLDLPVIELVYKILFQSFPPVELANRLSYGFRKR